MKIIGIAAEYNPLHEGHKYHLTQARKSLGADYIIVALSGDFCQRGVPAFLNKMTRAKMALLAGADMVVEIPAVYATSSAEGYALGSVGILDATGCIDNICFGMESKYTEELEICASKIRNAKDNAKDTMNSYFKSGKSYAGALSEILGDEEILTPNNILGIEYINAILQIGSNIKPFGITRLGDYSSESLVPSDSANYSSASAIRKSIEDDGFDLCLNEIPEETRELLMESYGKLGPLFVNDFSEELKHQLLINSVYGYEDYLGIDRSLSDRIKNLLPEYENYEQFIELVKTRNLTYSHVARAFLHILLNIRKTSYIVPSSKKPLPYIHVLGFRKGSEALLKELKASSKAPIIYTAEDSKALEGTSNMDLLNIDLISSQIYNSKLQKKYGVKVKADFASPVLKI
ncbi:MAG: nucleotidyltransferase family protein [Lachnospiraceae bacterium]|nr:nucleotidyltransferase family protein [Lachnospiraceae bacterium]